MWMLTIKGKPYGYKYPSEKAVREAWARMSLCIDGLGWKKVRA